MKQENKDVVGEKYIRDNNGVLVINDKNKKKSRDYKRLLFCRNP